MTISVELSSQPIELYKLLKIANLVGGGGEAKIVITEGYVTVNNELVTQKRKKIYHNDVVEFNGEVIQLICHQAPTVPTKKTQKPKENKASKPAPVIQGGRRKITF